MTVPLYVSVCANSSFKNMQRKASQQRDGQICVQPHSCTGTLPILLLCCAKEKRRLPPNPAHASEPKSERRRERNFCDLCRRPLFIIMFSSIFFFSLFFLLVPASLFGSARLLFEGCSPKPRRTDQIEEEHTHQKKNEKR